jgi:anaerobic ribonucleoside-triphosphate reductase activating protein
MELYMAQYLPCSKANGPGKRSVVWVQGCDKRCINCCNEQFQEFYKINPINIDELSNNIIKDYSKYSLRGITFSGGEPLHKLHKQAIQKLIKTLKDKINIDIMAFSGYSDEEIPDWSSDYFDMIISGPYIEKLNSKKGIISSSNQKIIRYNNKFDDISDNELINNERIIEINLDKDNNIIVSGLISVDNLKGE